MRREIPNLRHLRVVREVGLCHSISHAAEREHLSQPAVTQAVAKIEAELGLDLFERTSAGLFATEAGAGFLERVDRALEHLASGVREVARSGAKSGARPPGRGFRSFERLMTAAQVRALIALSEASNFSMAARSIGISQPSIHRSARNLERLAGVPLFRTTLEGVTLTPPASQLAQRAKLALSELRQGFDEVDAFLGRDSTQIVVGSLPLARTQILPFAVDRMVRAHPGVQIRVVDGPYGELLRALREGAIDCIIGALRDPPPVDDIMQEELFDDPLAIIAAHNHPLAQQASVSIEQARQYPWVAPPKTTPAGSYLFQTLELDKQPQSPVRVVTSSLILIRGLLLSGPYLTMISLHQIKHERDQGLLVPLDINLANSNRPIGVTTRCDWRPTRTQRQFLECIRQASRAAHEETLNDARGGEIESGNPQLP